MVMDVESHEPASSVSWQISDLVATIDGVVAGPPPAIVLGPTTRPKDESDAEPAEQEK